jgi:hypothetical protein
MTSLYHDVEPAVSGRNMVNAALNSWILKWLDARLRNICCWALVAERPAYRSVKWLLGGPEGNSGVTMQRTCADRFIYSYFLITLLRILLFDRSVGIQSLDGNKEFYANIHSKSYKQVATNLTQPYAQHSSHRPICGIRTVTSVALAAGRLHSFRGSSLDRLVDSNGRLGRP